MLNRVSSTMTILVVFGCGLSRAEPPETSKKVLVELYTSQGCNSCPPASDLLGKLAKLGYGPDRVVVVNFHVDYFNEPWVDPFSDPLYSRRQGAYNDVLKRNDLYFTPMMMVDGRIPLLGSDQPKALAALAKTRKDAPGVALELALGKDEAGKKSVSVKIASRSPRVNGRDLLVGVVVTEDRVATKVPSGENRGRTLVEYNVARSFTSKIARLANDAETKLSLSVSLPTGADGEHSRVAVFVQDRETGAIYQAESIPWASPKTSSATNEKTVSSKRKTHRFSMDWLTMDFFSGSGASNPSRGPTTFSCPDCGVSIDRGLYNRFGRRVSTMPTVPC